MSLLDHSLLRILAVVIGFAFTALLNLYFFSYKWLSYNRLVLKQNFFPPKDKVLIYGATTYFGQPFWSEDMVSRTCSKDIEEFCQFTTDPDRSKEADAWLYHNRDFRPELMENRGSEQVHVMFTVESPTHENKTLYPSNTINWTMTYKKDSDIFVPYGIFVKNDSINDLDFIWNMKSPNVTASWMVGHCNTANGRENLIRKARDVGLQLDIYGGCFNGLQIPNCASSSPNWEICAGAALQKYFFYFSFENSNCVDYVTEKLYNSWIFYYTVPIVIKREIYTNMGFPPKSFIALDDFDSIQDMVDFLNVLKTNKEEYLSYHEWRKEYELADLGQSLIPCLESRGPDHKPASVLFANG